MELVWQLRLFYILQLVTFCRASDRRIVAPRPKLTPLTAHDTVIYAPASSIPTATCILPISEAQATHFEIRPRADTITAPPAVIVSEGVTLRTFPPSVCGFVDGQPDTILACAADSLTRRICAVANSTLCCALNGICTLSSYTDCQNVRITDRYDANWGATSFIISNKLYCDLYQEYQCATQVLGSVASRTFCQYTSSRVSESIWPTQQFLNYFAGYTLEWYGSWKLTAIRSPSSTSTSKTSSTSTLGSSATDYFAKFRAGVPACASNMTQLCPELYSAISKCVKVDAAGNVISTGNVCFCNAFTGNSCPGLCLANHEPNDYLNYVIPDCEKVYTNLTSHFSNSSSPQNFTAMWHDYTNLSDAAYLRLFPWAWSLERNHTELINSTTSRSNYNNSTDLGRDLAHCPSVRSSLVAFAIVNTIVFVASIITANRKFVYIVTFKFFGGEEGGKWWPASAILSVMINLAGNIINAKLLTRTPGYHHVPLTPLILLWCTRPRLAWLVILLVWFTIQMGGDGTTYFNSAVAAILAEVILQTFAAVYIGMTINYARINKFYLIGHLKYTPHGNDALIMYVGALIWTLYIGIVFLRTIWSFTPVGNIMKDATVSVWDHLKRLVLMIGTVIFTIAKVIWIIPRGICLFTWQRLCRFTHYYKQRRLRRKWTESGRRKSRWIKVPYKGEYTPVKTLFQFTNEEKEQKQKLTQANDVNFQTQLQRPEQSRSRSRSRSRSANSRKSKRSTRKPNSNNTNNDGDNSDITYEPIGRVLTNADRLALYIEEMGLKPKVLYELNYLVMFLLIPWAGQWIFCIGFVRMAQDLYCPPSIWTLTTVWSICSVLAVWCGASV